MLLFTTAEVDNLHGMDFKHGYVTEIYCAPEHSCEKSSLKIKDEEDEEYYFQGLGAHEALTNEDRKVQKYLNVIFCTYKGTKTVVAILKG